MGIMRTSLKKVETWGQWFLCPSAVQPVAWDVVRLLVYINFENAFLDFWTPFFDLYVPRPTLSPILNVIRQRSSMSCRQCHPFNITYFEYLAHSLRPKRLTSLSHLRPIQSINCYASPPACNHHQRCNVAVSLNVLLTDHGLQLSMFIHVLRLLSIFNVSPLSCLKLKFLRLWILRYSIIGSYQILFMIYDVNA